MGDFFIGWRRKVGVVTLVLACVFAGGWVKSLSTTDILNLRGRKQTILFSGNCSIALVTPQFELSRTWHTFPGSEHVFFGDLSFKQRGLRTGYRLEHNPEWELPNGLRSTFWTASYWSIVIPLTILSAYLLIVQPKSVKPAPDTVGISN